MQQILVRFYNLIHQDAVIIALFNLLLFLFSVCFYIVIHLGFGKNGISIPYLIFFTSLGFDAGLAIVLCFGAYAGIHTESLRLLEFLKEKVVRKLYKNREQKWLIKLVKKYSESFPPFKVYVGSVNFVQKETPFVFTAEFLLQPTCKFAFN